MSNKIFKDLKEGLEELIEHSKGNVKLRTSHVKVSAPPVEYDAKKVKKIREQNNYSQAVLAQILVYIYHTIH